MIYLDNASTSWPKPPAVAERMADAVRLPVGNPGRGQHGAAEAAARIVEGARSRLARLLGAGDASRVALAFNATDALNIAIKGALAGGGHAVTTELEHNSVLRPLAALEAAGRVRVSRVAPLRSTGAVDPEEVVALVGDETRLVAVTHASNVTGAVQPVAEIARLLRERGSAALVLVDAAQTAGVLDLDVERDGFDLVAGSGHKGLLGPTGTGFLYASARARIEPWREGGTGSDSAAALHPREMPALLEGGTANVAGLAGLAAGLEYLEARGIADVRAHETRLAERLAAGLASMPHVMVLGRASDAEASTAGPAPLGVPGTESPAPGAAAPVLPARRTPGPDASARVAVVSFTVEGYEPEDVAAILDSSFGIAARAGMHCAPRCHAWLGTAPSGAVRLSPGPFSSDDDVAAALDALAELGDVAL